MTDVKKVVVIGGGTVAHVRNHLALCTPAYGGTARTIAVEASKRFKEMKVDLHLTKMAGGTTQGCSLNSLETNEDVDALVTQIIEDLNTKVVFFNVALCDFEGAIPNDFEPGKNTPSGKYEPRLNSRHIMFSSSAHVIWLHTAKKIVGRIRAKRKDIFLVAFKTTCGATEDEQYIAGLNLLKESSCNLVLANDTKTRLNMIITPEEARYHVTTDREDVLKQLVDMAYYRSHLSFTRSTVVAGEPVAWDSDEVPESLRRVVDYCIWSGAYKPFRGVTVGHFACQISPTEFLTSVRKTNFNYLPVNGLVRVKTDGPDTVIAYGMRPSVGGQSQRIVFSEHPGFDCIVHFHCPIKEGSAVPRISQREYECGSHQCGQRTSTHLQEFKTANGKVLAVYLDNHGPNIVFNRDIEPTDVIEFIEANFDLEGKTGGPVS